MIMLNKGSKYFDFSHFKGDFLGGITAGVVALPLALAFGVSSGLGAAAGLYGAIFVGFFAALFGGTNTQISGPTAPMTAVSMMVIAGVIASFDGNISQALPTILTVFLLAGVLQIVLGLLGIGRYVSYIPAPVISGFMTAIGVIILITQILPAVGYNPIEDRRLVEKFKPQAEENILEKILVHEVMENIMVLERFDETIERAQNVPLTEIQKEAEFLAGQYAGGVMGVLRVLPRALVNIRWVELFICLATILLIFGFKRIIKSIPSTLLSLIVVSSIAYFFHLDYVKISVIPQGLPVLNWGIFSEFDFVEVSQFIFSAVTLALLGTIDSLLTSLVADNMTKTKHLPNKELMGQGAGNIMAALFGGIPGAGATIRTVVNIKSGGKTRISGMIAGLFLLFILLAIASIASNIPAAVLAGILITVGIDVMDYKGLRALLKMAKSEVAVMIVVLTLSVFWNLVYAVGIGLIMAALVFMKKMGDIGLRNSNLFKGDTASEVADVVPAVINNLYIHHLSGPLFFGSSDQLFRYTDELQPEQPVILNFEEVPYLDQSGLALLEESLQQMHQKKCLILVCGLQKQPADLLRNMEVIPQLISFNQLFEDVKSCSASLKGGKFVT